MKHLTLTLLFSLFAGCLLRANGVAIVHAEDSQYLTLVRSDVQVQVENQIAITVTTQWYRNDLGAKVALKYGFPMPAGATATALRWQEGGVWYDADFSASPQDTTLPGGNPGGGSNPALTAYLGPFPLYFSIEDSLAADSMIAIELTYVQLLPYKFGTVTYHYPNDYTVIQGAPLELQHFVFQISSARLIETLEMPGFPGALIDLGAYAGSAEEMFGNLPASKDYQIIYSLNADDLGLFSFSNFFPDPLGCDGYGQGFCAFIAEPSPEINGDVINKVFTLIIDRSGSMYGEKMQQAKEAARFIVEHLNFGDKFNIVDFSSTVSSFNSNHVDFNNTTQLTATNYINSLPASGSTNISGAFGTAIPQFADDQGSTYNIIIFLTDGQATSGITNTSQILQYVQQQIDLHEVNVSIFNFGIGSDVNKPLLTQLANTNKGIATFLENEELEQTITDFYLTVRNPVLLNTAMSFTPALVTETYPQPLPNLFKGVQMLVVGRYQTPGNVEINFSGEAFGTSVEYHYPMELTGADSAKFHFLPKLWARQKTDFLLQQYYAATDPLLAEGLEEEIVALSLCYGVITPFTSFEDNSGGPTSVPEFDFQDTKSSPLAVLSLSPNPASGPVTLRFSLLETMSIREFQIEVVDIRGVPVRQWSLPCNGVADYQTEWDLLDAGGKRVPAGIYWLRVRAGQASAAVKLILR